MKSLIHSKCHKIKNKNMRNIGTLSASEMMNLTGGGVAD